MPDRDPLSDGGESRLRCLGLLAHPTRDIDAPLGAIVEWARQQGADVLQIPFGGEHRDLSLPRAQAVDDCDLVVAIGGDGTTLAAIRAAAPAERPVLGVACGSLGALTTVPAGEVPRALARLESGDWHRRSVPGLSVAAEGCEDFVAYNDIAVIRGGEGQIKVTTRVDGALYTRLAGDGCIVSTPAGSAAYTIAAGGPLLAPELRAYTLTALPTHGGFSPPLVLGPEMTLELEVITGHGGGRLEIDGRLAQDMPTELSVTLVPDAATVVTFAGQESHLEGLRERGILTDSPRILADDKRARDSA